MRRWTSSAVLCVLVACGESAAKQAQSGPDADAGARHEDGGLDRDANQTRPVDAGSDVSSDEADDGLCPPRSRRGVVDVPAGVLPEHLTHFTCDNIYVLNGVVFVHSDDAAQPQVLTIDPGTVVQGQTTGAARGFLVVTRQGRIDATGTPEDPIVFTSAKPAGMRARDDWGGITLLGAASAGGTRRVEGFPLTVNGENIDPLLAYGPAAETAADDAHDCGTLRYVRVEFASFNAGGAQGNESNALQLYACGYRTKLDYLQSHLSGDDGIEIFGGTVDLSHVLITGASDDGLDWDDGWRGRGQFIAVQQHVDQADLGFEAGGSSETPLSAPAPRLFNVTLVGTNGAAIGKVGGRLRGASEGFLRNFIFLGFSAGALDIGGGAAGQNFRNGSLSLQDSTFFRAQASTSFPIGAEDTADDVDLTPDVTDDIDEEIELTDASQHNQIADPRLKAPFDEAKPSFVPRVDAPLGADLAATPNEAEADPRPAFFDPSAVYMGAFSPGGPDWTRDWTAFPSN